MAPIQVGGARRGARQLAAARHRRPACGSSPRGEYYSLWLEKDGEWAGTCGDFAVGEGETTVHMTVSYQFARL